MKISKLEKELIKIVQEDIPHSLTPFKEIAEKLNISENEVITILNSLKDRGVIRRFGAVLRHQKAGLRENGMIVWNIPDDKVDEIGEKFASFKEVTHCYERPRFQGWNYNVYTMVHGRSKEEIENFAKRLSEISGINDYRILYSIKEFKKSSMKYFLEDDDGQ